MIRPVTRYALVHHILEIGDRMADFVHNIRILHRVNARDEILGSLALHLFSLLIIHELFSFTLLLRLYVHDMHSFNYQKTETPTHSFRY